MLFRDRREAGRALGRRLEPYAGVPGLIVLGLPRGGVPVGWEVARHLGVPLDIFLVRKLGVPGHPELAMGAISTGNVRVMNQDVVEEMGITPAVIERFTQREQPELTRREHAYRGDRPPPRLDGRTVILVDDGLATGATMRAAVEACRAHHPRRVIVAVPVAASETCVRMERVADIVICLHTPEPFHAVGLWYDDFSQTTDAEVQHLLSRS